MTSGETPCITAGAPPGLDVRILPRNPLLVGVNDAPRSDVGKVALCEFVVGVVMEDYQAPGRRGAADQQIDDGQGTHCTRACEPVLRRIYPLPDGFRHWHIGVDVTKRLVHLIELVRIPRRPTELGPLWFARSDGPAEKRGAPGLGEFRLSLEPPDCGGIHQEVDQVPTAFSSARAATQPA